MDGCIYTRNGCTLFDCEFRELVECDGDVPTHNTATTDWDQHASQLLNQYHSERCDDDDDEDDDHEADLPVMSTTDMQRQLEDMRRSALMKANSRLLSALMEATDAVTQMRMTERERQTHINDYFTVKSMDCYPLRRDL